MECRLGLIQLAAGEDKAENLRAARAEIDRAVRDGAELVILPEMFCLPYETARFAEYAEAAGGPAQQMHSPAASTCLIAIRFIVLFCLWIQLPQSPARRRGILPGTQGLGGRLISCFSSFAGAPLRRVHLCGDKSNPNRAKTAICKRFS